MILAHAAFRVCRNKAIEMTHVMWTGIACGTLMTVQLRGKCAVHAVAAESAGPEVIVMLIGRSV